MRSVVCEGVGVTDWVIDLDGVMWRGRAPITGSADAVGTLVARGDRVLFCSNNSAESGPARAQRLAEHGIPPGCDVVTSADAVCALVEPGEEVVVVGGEGLTAALGHHGAVPRPAGEVDPGPLVEIATRRSRGEEITGPFGAVVVGLTRDFGYRELDVAAAAVRSGARLLASNADSTFPGADGLHPGCGSLVAAIETAAGRPAAVAGKPHEPMAALIRSRLGLTGAGGAPGGGGDVLVVGDRADTDGRLAVTLGVPFALVLSGVTVRADLPVEVTCARVADDLAELVASVTGEPVPNARHLAAIHDRREV